MAEAPTRIAAVSTPASESKATSNSHALPFSKNQLGIGSLVAALVALANSQLAVVTPPWILWAVAGLLVLGWIVHVIVVDHASIAGSLAVHARAADPAGHLFSDLASALPDLIAFMKEAAHLTSGTAPHSSPASAVAAALAEPPAAATAPSTGAP